MDVMQINDEIFVAGHRGLLGSAVVRALSRHGYNNLLLRSRIELDLLDQPATFSFFENYKPKFVFFCAAKVGGIQANVQGIGQFMYENLQIQNNVIEAARCAKVKKLVFVGSTCIYPLNAANPIREESLLQGPIEPTNEGYGLAKVAGVRLCQFYRRQYGCAFVSAIPCNLFGLNDHFDPNNSHVLQALIRKVHLARANGERIIELWGSGTPRREFLFADDCAEALIRITHQCRNR
jgi:GDP-L-fucose synthase